MQQEPGPASSPGSPEENESTSGSLKVLLVDDIQENLELLQDVLAESNYVSVLARNGVEALARLRHEKVHLIVADAMMPKMDGFQLCKEVKAQTIWTKIPFIIYTGNYVDGADQEFARSIGVDRYVVKYAGLGTLLQAVNELAQERYGFTTAPVETPERIDDQVFLEKHHAIIIKKLDLHDTASLVTYAIKNGIVILPR